MQPSHEDLSSEIERLKRRLQRERATRLHAELIAETGLRDLYERKQQLQLLEKIATASNLTKSVEGVLQFAVVQVCGFTQWEVGHSYLTVEDGTERRLRSTGFWHAPELARFEEFRSISETMEFLPGIGLPGRVLAAGKPLWITDVTDDHNFPRGPHADKCGLKGATAFPVVSGEDVVAVLEFFTSVAREPDAALLELMSQVGLQLGRVIERQQAEDRLRAHTIELARARDEARTADRAKSAFLANMSHELRTPLNAIIGFSDMIRAEFFGPVNAKYKSYATDINQSGLHLKDIINDILDISKMEAGHLELRDEIVSIEETIEACLDIVSGLAVANAITLSSSRPAALPHIRSEQVRLKQIVLNLLSNAVKFTPAGGRVTVSAWTDADGVVISVEDTGIGMEAEDIAVALQPFRQIDSELNRRYEGTGLGLPLTNALVGLHGGRLDIKSTPDKGTTVSVHLPRERLIDTHPKDVRAAASR